MKLSVSLSADDVVFLDRYAESQGMASRSAVVQRAVGLLRAEQLGPAYAEAWSEWAASGNAEVWETAISDGLDGDR